jgi:glycosyltransferase involved in cell wall biosynthesis
MGTPTSKIKLNLFMRKPLPGDHYSIERLYESVVSALPPDRYKVRILVCPFEGKGLFRRLALIIWAACLQGDVNHVTGDMNFLGLLMRSSRTLLTITDSASMKRLFGWKRWCYRTFWLRLPILHAGKVVVISEATLQETIDYVHTADSKKFLVIPCCIPMGILAKPKPSGNVSIPRILAVGTKPNKNLPRIIEALAGVPCRLVVVGALTDFHQELIVRHGLEVENHVDISNAEMALQYQSADLVVFVSTYEGFGLPILEGQMVGRPVITSRKTPMEIVAGAGACLVDPESVSDIREAVLRVINDSQYRDMLVQAGYENVLAYSPEIVARQYASVYEALFFGTTDLPEKALERLEKKSAMTEDRIQSILILGQRQPHVNENVTETAKPNYFADTLYFLAASNLRLKVKTQSAFHTKSLFITLWLSLIAFKKIASTPNQLAIVWQGYGTYAILAHAILGRKTRFILNTYKVPSSSPQPIKKRLNDKLLSRAISLADGVIAISTAQAYALQSLNKNTAWVPFASDMNWWSPGLPDYQLLASHGINFKNFILVMGDVDRDEKTTLNALCHLNHPILRVTRESETALVARRAYEELKITQGGVFLNIPFDILRELYRGARVVVVPARSNIHPAGMTSLTEAMCCGRPVVIPSGLATDGYVQDFYDAFVLSEWEESAIRDRVEKTYQTDIGESVGKNARNTMENRLNINASAKKAADFIARIDSLRIN